MTDQPRIERFLEQAARMASGAGIHPVEVLQRIQAAAEASIRDGAVANAYRVQYAPADSDRVVRLRDQLARGAGRMLDELARGRSLRQLGPWQFEFAEGVGLAAGTVRVSATYREPAHRPETVAVGATRVITRQRGKRLVLDDGTRVPLTHTPFVIGRGVGCDLVVPDLSISRRHAEICSGAGGSLTIRDLESRNGVILDGARIAGETELPPGAMFALGDARFWLEADA
ncbi:MAG: DUF3662 domain-containing protein [Dehalococcoidia bacterium]|nr:DUF3662 domain-containing protein [Dehalococcoidia bacterium]